MLKKFVFLLFIFIVFGFTRKSGMSYNLFHIGRSRDKNIIKYDINLDANGKINTTKPLKIYWVKYTNNNAIEALSYIQNTFAYGVDYYSISSTQVTFKFVSYSKRLITVKKNNEGVFKAFIQSNSKNVELSSIFVQIDGGTFMLPEISFVKLSWIDPVTKTEGSEIIKP
jgi:hypothetical protein